MSEPAPRIYFGSPKLPARWTIADRSFVLVAAHAKQDVAALLTDRKVRQSTADRISRSLRLYWPSSNALPEALRLLLADGVAGSAPGVWYFESTHEGAPVMEVRVVGLTGVEMVTVARWERRAGLLTVGRES
jgi:hypothetical protein